jgi:hypothetical protein
MKWLNVLEEWLRRWVHTWFLVPDGLERTIGVLEDARYDPPSSQLSLVENPATRERLQENLKAPTGTLRYRWARTAVLMVSLRQMGAGATHPLRRALEPPEDSRHPHQLPRARRDVEAVLNNPGSSDSEQLPTSADSPPAPTPQIVQGASAAGGLQGDIDQTLEEPALHSETWRRLLDIVFSRPS